MVAALSPADINYDETLSTLRYVCSAGDPGVRTCLSMIQPTPVKGCSFGECSLGTQRPAITVLELQGACGPSSVPIIL